MSRSAIPLFPFSDPQNYRPTLDQARRELAAGDPQEKAAHSGCHFEPARPAFFVTMLNHPFTVSYPNGEIKYLDSNLEPHFSCQILMLHYLSRADGTPLSHRYIPYRQLAGGGSYDRAFQKRAVQPLAEMFGACPEEMLPAAAAPLGGLPYGQGNVTGMLLYLFPRVPLLYLVWPGDEEFPARSSILFDATANHYLHTEDLAVCEFITDLLGKIHRATPLPSTT
ncbi:MAG: DUF3786 domain-containing protein [Dethiobacter sp.]|nr:DUF3786 domain-containing protein [Dethiobacter sp.]